MKRNLLTFAFALLVSAAVNAQVETPVIKMTTTENPGSWFMLGIEAEGELTYVGLTPDDMEGYYQTTAKEVEIHGKVKRLECSYNNLVSLDVSGDPYLIELLCDDNDLTSLTIGENPYLYRLYCGGNQLESIDVKGLTGLMDFSCYKNLLTSLDLTANTELTDLVCRSNMLEGVLDLSVCSKLKNLSCFQNKLTGIKLAENNALQQVELERNNITGAAMTDIMNALPAYKAFSSDEWDDWYGYNLQGLYVTEVDRTNENNMPLESDVKIAKDKGWPVFAINIDDYGLVVPTPFDGYSSTAVSSAETDMNNITVEQNGGTVKVGGLCEGSKAALFAADGKKVAEKSAGSNKSVTFNLSNIPEGIYLVRTHNVSRKISVKK